MNKNKKQTAVKGRSSALLISIAIHVILFLVAGYFVAVEVIERSETKFEGKQIVRPKMKLKKLQMPVKIEKVKRQAPKLRQRMTAKKVRSKSVDFKMPELAGFGDGTVANIATSGMGLGGGGLGFATTQLNVFGLKSRGEKVLFLLDSNNDMMTDEIGGIPAYEIIKDELTGLIASLPPTALFNVVVFEKWHNAAFSAQMSAASPSNIKQLNEWLESLNSELDQVGLKTLSSPGAQLTFEPGIPIGNKQTGWLCGLSYAIQKGVDAVYWLGRDATTGHVAEDFYDKYRRGKPAGDPVAKGWTDLEGYGEARWEKIVAEAREIYDAENARRKEEGLPMQVIPGHGRDRELVEMVMPGTPIPEWHSGDSYYYTGDDILDYIETMTKKVKAEDRRAVDIGLKKKKLIFNTIHFKPLVERDRGNDENGDWTPPPFVLETVAKKLGDYMEIKGMEAIESNSRARR